MHAVRDDDYNTDSIVDSTKKGKGQQEDHKKGKY